MTSAMWLTVLGGARSGKTDLVEAMCLPFSKVLWWGTALDHGQDSAWHERLNALKARRDPGWTTFDGPWAWPTDEPAIRTKNSAPVADVFVMDCLNLWLAAQINRSSTRYASGQLKAHLEMEFAQLCAALSALACRVVLVSAEVGWGVVPAGEHGRLFRDLLSDWNCRIVRQSDYGVSLQAGRAFLWPAGRTPLPDQGSEVRCVDARHLSRLLGAV